MFRKSAKLKSVFVRACNTTEDVLFVKPVTFMNNSGQALRRVRNMYEVDDEDFLVVYDDMDLELGRMKFVRQGSSGGHKGMASVIEVLGRDKVNRLKIGISRHDGDAVDYVLSDFSGEEKKIMDRALETAVCACQEWVTYGMPYAMQKYNVRKIREKKEG